MPGPYGVSFMPGADAGTGRPGAQRNPVQEAIQVLSMRLPKSFGSGASAIAPLTLLSSPGGMGQPGARGGSATAQALAQLAGLPVGTGSGAPVLPRPPFMPTPPPVSPAPPPVSGIPPMPGRPQPMPIPVPGEPIGGVNPWPEPSMKRPVPMPVPAEPIGGVNPWPMPRLNPFEQIPELPPPSRDPFGGNPNLMPPERIPELPPPSREAPPSPAVRPPSSDVRDDYETTPPIPVPIGRNPGDREPPQEHIWAPPANDSGAPVVQAPVSPSPPHIGFDNPPVLSPGIPEPGETPVSGAMPVEEPPLFDMQTIQALADALFGRHRQQDFGPNIY